MFLERSRTCIVFNERSATGPLYRNHLKKHPLVHFSCLVVTEGRARAIGITCLRLLLLVPNIAEIFFFFQMIFYHLLPKQCIYFHVRLINGVARIFATSNAVTRNLLTSVQLHLFEGPWVRTLYRLSYRGSGYCKWSSASLLFSSCFFAFFSFRVSFQFYSRQIKMA